jgi:uncharacterized protein (DUF1800 family)
MAVLSLRAHALWVVALLLSACGGSGGGAGGSPPPSAVLDLPASREAAAKFLAQATFGPTEAEVDRLLSRGYSAWVDDQLAKPAFSHRAAWEAVDAKVKAADPNANAGQNGVSHAFWKAAVSADDPLRQKVAYAWSQILVISMQDSGIGEQPRAVAAYVDMLADKGLGTYRDLLEGVSRHPLMGRYLSHGSGAR